MGEGVQRGGVQALLGRWGDLGEEGEPPSPMPGTRMLAKPLLSGLVGLPALLGLPGLPHCPADPPPPPLLLLLLLDSPQDTPRASKLGGDTSLGGVVVMALAKLAVRPLFLREPLAEKPAPLPACWESLRQSIMRDTSTGMEMVRGLAVPAQCCSVDVERRWENLLLLLLLGGAWLRVVGAEDPPTWEPGDTAAAAAAATAAAAAAAAAAATGLLRRPTPSPPLPLRRTVGNV